MKTRPIYSPKLVRKANRLKWMTLLIILLFSAMLMLFMSCESKSGQQVRQRTTKTCVVLSTKLVTSRNSHANTIYRLKTINDIQSVIINRTYPNNTTYYEVGDTILLHSY